MCCCRRVGRVRGWATSQGENGFKKQARVLVWSVHVAGSVHMGASGVSGTTKALRVHETLGHAVQRGRPAGMVIDAEAHRGVLARAARRTAQLVQAVVDREGEARKTRARSSAAARGSFEQGVVEACERSCHRRSSYVTSEIQKLQEGWFSPSDARRLAYWHCGAVAESLPWARARGAPFRRRRRRRRRRRAMRRRRRRHVAGVRGYDDTMRRCVRVTTC